MKKVVFCRGTYFLHSKPPSNPLSIKNFRHHKPLNGVYHNTQVVEDENERISDILESSELYAKISAEKNGGLPMVVTYVVSEDTFGVLAGRIFSEHTALDEKIAVPVNTFDYLLRETIRVQMIVDGSQLQPQDFERLHLKVGTAGPDGRFSYREYSDYISNLEGVKPSSVER